MFLKLFYFCKIVFGTFTKYFNMNRFKKLWLFFMLFLYIFNLSAQINYDIILNKVKQNFIKNNDGYFNLISNYNEIEFEINTKDIMYFVDLNVFYANERIAYKNIDDFLEDKNKSGSTKIKILDGNYYKLQNINSYSENNFLNIPSYIQKTKTNVFFRYGLGPLSILNYFGGYLFEESNFKNKVKRNKFLNKICDFVRYNSDTVYSNKIVIDTIINGINYWALKNDYSINYTNFDEFSVTNNCDENWDNFKMNRSLVFIVNKNDFGILEISDYTIYKDKNNKEYYSIIKSEYESTANGYYNKSNFAILPRYSKDCPKCGFVNNIDYTFIQSKQEITNKKLVNLNIDEQELNFDEYETICNVKNELPLEKRDSIIKNIEHFLSQYKILK